MRTETENYTRLSIDLAPALHKTLKLHVIHNHTNIKDYVAGLIKEDLSEELEDYLLGQMALEAKKEGSLGVKESEKFFKKLKKSVSEKPASKTIATKKSKK
jgi:predicted DNA-binding protein